MNEQERVTFMNKNMQKISHYSVDSYFYTDFPAQIMFHEQKMNIWHDHDFYELVLVISGEGFNKTLQRKIPFKSGSLFFLKPEDIHSYQIIGETALLVNLLIKKEFIENNHDLAFLFKSIERTKCTAQLDPKSDIYKRLLNNVQLLDEESKNVDEFSKKVFETLLCETLYLVTRAFISYTGDNDTQQHATLIGNYIAKNLDEKPQLSAIAALTGTNASYISRNFKKITGYKFVELVNEHRIQKVCNSLANSNTNIDDIYHKSGYKSKVYFYRIFKRVMGMSPLQYRKQVNNS